MLIPLLAPFSKKCSRSRKRASHQQGIFFKKSILLSEGAKNIATGKGIDLSGFGAGIYIVEVAIDAQVYRQKVVVL